MPKIRKDEIERKVFSSRMDPALSDKIKEIAFYSKKEIFEVVEEAFREYIANRVRSKGKAKGKE
jgi:predicted transcriptional regulator